MGTRPAKHPTAEILKAFSLGKLDESSSGVLLNHLDLCAECRQVVASQSGDDFLERIRQAHSRSITPAPAQSLGGMAGKPKPPPGPTALFNLPPELADNPQYEILKELGRGGMGVVYLARNKLMDRLEVLKVINKALLDRAGAVERFLREIRAAAKLNHANVVNAHSALQLGELLVFAMEYVDGQDLAAVVKASGPLPVPHACFYVQQAAQGLQHAFEKKMVHRDIKPQNLILAREGRKHLIKILDFGLAKVMVEKSEDTGLTGEGKMLGTPDYMAPEQTLDATSADIRADIYSLGCTLYFLLSGSRPFKGKNLFEIMQAHQSMPAPALQAIRPEVPVELAAVVSKMMAKDRARRYQTPLEVVQALGPFVKQSPQKSSSQSSPGLPGDPPAAADLNARTMSDSASATAPTSRAVPRRRSPAVQTVARKKWLMGGGIAAIVLFLTLLGMGASGVFKVKTKDGTILLKNVPPDAEVTVDGGQIALQTAEGDSFTISIAAGKKQRLQVKKEGFTTFGEEVEIEAGGRRSITVRLEPLAAAAPDIDRRAAEWALALKGSIRLRVKKKEKEIGPDGRLPEERFELVEIKLTGKPVGDKALGNLKGLTHLTHLFLWGAGISDAGLPHLKDLASLSFLGLFANPKVTDAGLVHLTRMTNLRNLDLNGTGVTDAGMVHLKSMTNLDALNLMSTRTTGAGFVHLKGLTNFKVLLLAGSWVDDEGLAQFQALSKLEHIGLDHTRISDKGLVHLKGLKQLRELFLSKTKVTKAGVADLQKALPACRIVADDIAGVALPKQLEEVRARLKELNPGFDGEVEYGLDGTDVVKLSFVTTAVKDISPLRALPRLRNLACGGAWPVFGQITDLKPLEGMKLTSLYCRDTQVADLSPLKGMPLTELVCTGTKVADLSPLKGMPLTTLHIDSTPVADLSPLKGMKLETLNCFASQVTDLSPLKDMKLKFLDCNAHVTAAGLAPLEEMLSLRDLRIGGPKMTEDGLTHLKKLTQLESLHVLDTPLTEAGLRDLQGMTRLETLVLPNTGLTDEAVVHLKALVRLRSLNLARTRVTDAGLEHLASLEHLVELNVEKTAVTDKGVAKLKAALPRCNIIR